MGYAPMALIYFFVSRNLYTPQTRTTFALCELRHHQRVIVRFFESIIYILGLRFYTTRKRNASFF